MFRFKKRAKGINKKKLPVQFNIYETSGDFSILILAINEEKAHIFCKKNFPLNFLPVTMKIENVFVAGEIIP